MFYLVSSDVAELEFRILKLDRTVEKPKLLNEILREDSLVYNKLELADLLSMIHHGNKSTGGVIKVASGYGLVGFVKFIDCYYFTIITQRKLVGNVASNHIYTIKATETFSVKPKEKNEGMTLTNIWNKLNKKLNSTNEEIAESRYLGLYHFVDMTKDFFFSYSYDITFSLQHNFLRSLYNRNQTDTTTTPATTAVTTENSSSSSQNINKWNDPQEIFEWNFYQTEELKSVLHEPNSGWLLPLIHGSFQQRRFSIFGRPLDMILIARRSRHYAGTRYLKRGLSVDGYVANDCETEQILQVDHGFHMRYCSYVQMRGSVPTHWSQETSVTMPKPPILLNRRDPSYAATKLHFKHLFQRYNAPIVVLDLVKHEGSERKPRECIIGRYKYICVYMGICICVYVYL